MKCATCSFENRDGANFCLECGKKLESKCPSCGKNLPPTAKFCDECGHNIKDDAEIEVVNYEKPQSYTPKHLAEKILTTRSSIEGERKLVTVLFADVANYTNISEKLDPEEIHQIMDGCFKILMDETHRYEGTINQFTGDGVMALFGAPISHEDHAQRACYAALSINKSIKKYGDMVRKNKNVEFKMRVGLNSGTVVVGAIGDDLRMDYTAVGDTTNLAARIQQAAKPGEIWLSQETRSSIKGFFQVENIGNYEFKGKSNRQPVFRLLLEHKEVRTRFEAGLAKGVTGLVGRKPEMQILKTAWERTKEGDARIVDIVGEAGVGKSRLIYEFQKTIGEEATFLTGICIHYGRNINFLPLIDIVRSVFGIDDGMSEEEAGHCIQERAKNELVTMIPFYRNLLSLKVDDAGFNSLNPEGRKFGTFEAIKQLILSVSEIRPLVVFIEDVHWIDKISEDFFVFFSHSIRGKNILMLSAYRPEGDPGWAKGPHYRFLGLETLSVKSSGYLVRNILGGYELDPDLENLIVDKTGGNPFFIEELVRELVDRKELKKENKRYVLCHPINHLNIPGTVQGIIAARMDRLNENLKKTMQVASVIGRDFAYKILQSILELGNDLRKHLTNLVGIEVLYEKSLYPELEYIFKHALTQEVAYDSLLKQRRQEIHGRIAMAIEELYADRLEQHYEFLSHHWELSGNLKNATNYLVLAGKKSIQVMAADAAINFFSKAIKLIEQFRLDQDPLSILQIRLERARAYQIIGNVDSALIDFEEAIRLSNTLRDKKKSLEILNEVPWVLYNTSLKDKVPEYCDRALALAKDLGDKGAEAGTNANYAFWRYAWEDTYDIPICEQALAMAEESGDIHSVFRTRIILSLFERWRGNPLKAIQYSEGLQEILKSVYNLHAASSVCYIHAWSLIDIGKYSEAHTLLNEWLNISEQNDLNLALGRIYNSLGWALSETYSLDSSLSYNKKSLMKAMELINSSSLGMSASEMRSMSEVNIMENLYELGKIDEAWNHIINFEEISIQPKYDIQRIRWTTKMNDLKGNILLDRGDIDGAESMVKQCKETSKKMGIKKYIGKVQRLNGRVLAEREDYSSSENQLKKALIVLKKVGNPKQLWMTHTVLAKLYKKMERYDLEQEQWKIALRIVLKVAEELQDNNLKDRFTSAVPITDIYKNAHL